MREHIKTALIIVVIIGILVISFFIYQKVTYVVDEKEVTQVDNIEDKKTPEEQEEEVVIPDKPLPVIEEEVPVIEEDKEPVIGMNEIRRDPVILKGKEKDNNDWIFMEGDIEEITDIVDDNDVREDTGPTEEDLEKLRKEQERKERNKEYVDARLNAVSINTGNMGKAEFDKQIPKKGMVVIYWSTVTDGGLDTVEKWIEYFKTYGNEIEFVFLNRGFEIEQHSNITEFIKEKEWDIPLYFDNMLSFTEVQGINRGTEGFFINKDGYIMGREATKGLENTDAGIKGLIEFYEKHREVWTYIN